VPATQKEWIKRLQREGWTRERGGKHQVKMTKPGHRPITLPENKRRVYSKGFEAELSRQAGLRDDQE
jgi:predicted RNA binding protein YcfA (HicA-like mRNA interferase family)